MGGVLRRALGGADVSRARCANSSTEPGRNRMRSAAHGARWHRITRSMGTGSSYRVAAGARVGF